MVADNIITDNSHWPRELNEAKRGEIKREIERSCVTTISIKRKRNYLSCCVQCFVAFGALYRVRSMKICWGSHCLPLRASLKTLIFFSLNGILSVLNLLLFQKQYCAIHNMPRLCLQQGSQQRVRKKLKILLPKS